MRHFRGAGFPFKSHQHPLPRFAFLAPFCISDRLPAPIELLSLKFFLRARKGVHGLNPQAILVVAHR